MPWINKEIVERAKRINALDWLLAYEPTEVIRTSDGHYQSREHDSLKFSNGKWMWWSRGIGGRSAVDYFIHVKGYDFQAAVYRVLGTGAMVHNATEQYPPAFHNERQLELPIKDSNNYELYRYLQGRGINENVITYFINKGILYQEKTHKNIVFLGKDYDGNIKLATMRGTGGDFKNTVIGSDRRYPFSSMAHRNVDNGLHVFEGAIDMLSYATIMYESGMKVFDTDMIALLGVVPKKKDDIRAKADAKFPSALTEYYKYYPGHKLFLHLDNDKAGRNATELILCASAKIGVEAVDVPPPQGKDMNEYLQILRRNEKI